MAVNITRAAGILTVTVTVDVSDIIAATGISNAEKKVQALRRALDHLANAVQVGSLTDAQLDQQVTDTTAQVTQLKAARPGGTF